MTYLVFRNRDMNLDGRFRFFVCLLLKEKERNQYRRVFLVSGVFFIFSGYSFAG